MGPAFNSTSVILSKKIAFLNLDSYATTTKVPDIPFIEIFSFFGFWAELLAWCSQSSISTCVALNDRLNWQNENFHFCMWYVWVVEEWADQVGGGGWKTLCIKIGYIDPGGAENTEKSSTLVEKSRVTWCSILIGWRPGWRNTRLWLADEDEGFFRARFWLVDEVWGFFVLDSDWLPTIFPFCAKAKCVRQCIKIRSWVIDPFLALWDFFGKNFSNFSPGPREDNYYGAD